MLQKEVAKRIVSLKGSILSISVQIFGKPKYIATVKKSFFKPAPKVDSAILLIDEISNPFQNAEEREKFFLILKSGFAQKRKKLSSNLKKNFKNPEEALKACGLNENTRAEELSLENWKCLISRL
jgi:16S rRNA (adenine1518-N6/adenine1519-N6)-dimethyltransferase